ncbi:MAG: hypothetical protein ABJG42_24280 [Vibrio splendidus]
MMITLNHTTELVRANFIDVTEQQAIIAVFESFEDVTDSKKAIFYHVVDIRTKSSEDSFFDARLDQDVQDLFFDCFNVNYVVNDAIYELSLMYKDNIKLDANDSFDQCVFHAEFLISDLDRKYFK